MWEYEYCKTVVGSKIAYLVSANKCVQCSSQHKMVKVYPEKQHLRISDAGTMDGSKASSEVFKLLPNALKMMTRCAFPEYQRVFPSKGINIHLGT